MTQNEHGQNQNRIDEDKGRKHKWLVEYTEINLNKNSRHLPHMSQRTDEINRRMASTPVYDESKEADGWKIVGRGRNVCVGGGREGMRLYDWNKQYTKASLYLSMDKWWHATGAMSP
jgi:hypothetical protein